MRVWATSEEIRKLIKHPTGGAFPEDIAQATEWPDDQFTTRRIRDGDVTLEQPAPEGLRKGKKAEGKQAEVPSPDQPAVDSPPEGPQPTTEVHQPPQPPKTR